MQSSEKSYESQKGKEMYKILSWLLITLLFSITLCHAEDKAGNRASLSRVVHVMPKGKILIIRKKGNTASYGGYSEFNIALSYKPTHPVEIFVESDNPNEEIVPKSEAWGWNMKTGRIVIHPKDWKLGEQIEVKGSNKNVINGKQDYHIVTSPAVSDDPRFDGVDAEDVWMRGGEVLELKKPDLTHITFVPGLESRFKIDMIYNSNYYDGLKLQLLQAPEGMKIENGYAVWTPKTSDNSKSYNIELKITNGSVSSRINFKINVVTLGKALPTVIKDNSLIVQSTKTCDFSGNKGRFAITLPEEYKDYLNDIRIRPIEIYQMPAPYKSKPLSCLFKIETFNDMHKLQKNNKELHIKVELPIYNHQGLFNILFDTKLYVYHSGYFIKHLGAEWFWDTLYRVEKTNLLGIRYDTDFVNLEKTMYSENILDGVYLIGRGESAIEIVPLSEKKTLKKESSKKAYSKVKKLCTPEFLEINSTFPYVYINNYNKITCETTLNGKSYIVHVKGFGEGKKWGSINNPQVTVDEMFGIGDVS